MPVETSSNSIVARHFETAEWVEVEIVGERIGAIRPAERVAELRPDDLWMATGLWDIQTNGRWGVSYSDVEVKAGRLAEIIQAQARLGTARLCPTLITAPFQSLANGLGELASVCEQDRRVSAMVVGIHLEGPYLSEVDGYRGAHPVDAIEDPDWEQFQRFQDLAGGRIILMTIAPERPGAIAFINRAVKAGVVIALGHTAADGPTIQRAVDAGASLSTHLGNGIASHLPRHPNPIWEQAANDGLSASFIADGHHLDRSTLRTLVRAKSLNRSILVSDASPLAGLVPGVYGPWEVATSGKIVVSGTPYLAGSNQGLDVGLNVLMQATGISVAEAFATVTTNPARLLRRTPPAILTGEPANLLIYRQIDNQTIRFETAYVDGMSFPCDDHSASPTAT